MNYTSKMTSSSFYKKCLESFIKDELTNYRRLSSNTIDAYVDTFYLLHTYFNEKCGIGINNISIEDYNKDNIQDFLIWYHEEKNVKESTLNQRLSFIKVFVDYIQMKIGVAPLSLTNIIKIKHFRAAKAQSNYLSFRQVKLILSQPNVSTERGFVHKLIMALLYETGCRVTELSNLNFNDVKISKKNKDEVEVQLFKTKGNKQRSVYVSGNIAKMLIVYLDMKKEYNDTNTPLLCNHSDNRISRHGIAAILNKYCKMAREIDETIPEKIHPHSLRHSKATHLCDAGVPLPIIAEILGHESITTTMVYAHANEEKLKEYSKMASLKIDQKLPSSKIKKSSKLEKILGK